MTRQYTLEKQHKADKIFRYNHKVTISRHKQSHSSNDHIY